MNKSRMAAGLAALGLSAGLTACGSSSSSNSTSTGTAPAGLSRAALAARANTICSTAQSQSRLIKAPANLASDAVAAARYYDKVYPITDAETKELQALTPSSAAAADWQSFVAAQVAADSLLLQLKQKAEAKDPSGLNLLNKVAPAGQVVTRTAAKVGATTCAAG